MKPLLEPDILIPMFIHWGSFQASVLTISESCSREDFEGRFSQIVEIKSNKKQNTTSLFTLADILFVSALDIPNNPQELLKMLMYLKPGAIAIFETGDNWKIQLANIVQVATATNCLLQYSGKSSSKHWHDGINHKLTNTEILILEKQLPAKIEVNGCETSIILIDENLGKLHKWIDFIEHHELENRLQIVCIINKSRLQKYRFLQTIDPGESTTNQDSMLRQCISQSISHSYLFDNSKDCEVNPNEYMQIALKANKIHQLNSLKSANQINNSIAMECMCVHSNSVSGKIISDKKCGFYFFNHKTAHDYFSVSHQSKIRPETFYFPLFLRSKSKTLYKHNVNCKAPSQ